jgi:hypothetical protein
MGKRSSFARIERDAYDTPAKAVAPLLDHLVPCTQFIECCCGRKHLVGHLECALHRCISTFDLPDDARTRRYVEARPGVVFITNPPWARPALHEIILNLSDQLPTWLLMDADWMHTRQAIPFLPRLKKIVSVGRVRWIPNSPHDGKDNCAWYLFDRPQPDKYVVIFYGRANPPVPEAALRRVQGGLRNARGKSGERSS